MKMVLYQIHKYQEILNEKNTVERWIFLAIAMQSAA